MIIKIIILFKKLNNNQLALILQNLALEYNLAEREVSEEEYAYS